MDNIQKTFIAALVLSLAGCGGGSSGGGTSGNGSSGGTGTGTGGSSGSTDITPGQGPGDSSNISALEVDNKWLYQYLYDDPNTTNIDQELQYRDAEITQRIGTLFDFEYRTFDDQSIEQGLEILASEPEGLAFYGPIEGLFNEASPLPFSYYTFYSLNEGQSNQYVLQDQDYGEDLDGDTLFETYSVTTEISRESDEILETFVGSLTTQKFVISITISIQGTTGTNASETVSLIQWRLPGVGMVKQQEVVLGSSNAVLAITDQADILGFEVSNVRSGLSNLEVIAGDPQQTCNLDHNPKIVSGGESHLILYTDLIDPNLCNSFPNISIFAKLINEEGEVSDTSFSYPQATSDTISAVWHNGQFKVLLLNESEELRLVSIDASGNQLDADPMGLLLDPNVFGSGNKGYAAIASDGTQLAIVLPYSDGEDSIYYWTIDADQNLSARSTLAENIEGGTLQAAPTSLYHDGEDFIFLWLQYNTSAPFDYNLLAKRLGESSASAPYDLLTNEIYAQYMSVVDISGAKEVRIDFLDGPEYKVATLNSSNSAISADSVSTISENPLALGRNRNAYLWDNHLIGKGARAVLSNGDEYVVWQHGIRMSLGALLADP